MATNRTLLIRKQPIARRTIPRRAFYLMAVVACGLVLGTFDIRDVQAERAAGPPATLAIVNAKIWTDGNPGKSHPGNVKEPTALAVIGADIVAIGQDAVIRARVGPNTRVIDARGRRVIPGITDSHTHFIGGGFQLDRLALRDVQSREEFIRAVEAAAKNKKPGQWVVGGRWSVESWADPTAPDRSWLDPVTGDTPVYLTRMDGHQALINSAALRLAGIDAHGPDDPKGGEIVRDPKTGEPTGILKESAKDLVEQFIPPPTAGQQIEALHRAMRHANSLGITSVHDMSEPADLPLFRRADGDGKLTVRITSYLSISDWPAHIDEVKGASLKSEMFNLAGLKGYMDGSLGSRTAYMREPYSDATPLARHPRGHLTAMADPPAAFREVVAMADAQGVQLAVHAIGDEANHLLLGAYESAAQRNGRRDARHRIEHAQHLRVEDIPRFARLGVVASMQPFHKADDGRYAETALGQRRLEGSYAFRQLVDAGALLCFGSDWPVVTLDPFAGIDAAVNARTLAGKVWLASHSLSVEEALHAYTAAPARAIHREDRLGAIKVGHLADLVILTDDPFALPVERIGNVTAAQTIVGGKVVYTRADKQDAQVWDTRDGSRATL